MPRMVRGLVITEENEKGLVGQMQARSCAASRRSRFLAYDIRDLPSQFTARARAKGLPVLSWTVCAAGALAERGQYADAAIFEGAAQPRNG